MEFHVGSLNQGKKSLPGRVLVNSRKKTAVSRGDVVQFTGKLKETKGTSRQGLLTVSDVVVIWRNTGILEKLRARFFKSVLTVIPEPYGGLGLGYLLGFRATISKTLKDQLAITGLTHIIAVSGYNLTILVQAIRRLFGKRSAYQSVVYAWLLLFGFIAVAGGSPSINRAAIVCGFSLLAWYYGRAFKPLVLLLLSGAITALLNPLYVWGDPGWYLSFLAFAGILILAPLVTAVLFNKKTAPIITQIFIETLSAQLLTIPYTLYLFGGVSVIAPFANVLVLPFIPIIMLFIFIVGCVGMVAPTVALWVAILPRALLTLQVWLIEKLSTVPFAHIEFTISAFDMVVLFLLIACLILFLYRVNQRINPRIMPDISADLI